MLSAKWSDDLKVHDILSQFDPTGLIPTDGIWIDASTPRESLKGFYLSQGKVISKSAIFSSHDLARRVVGHHVTSANTLSRGAIREFLEVVLKGKDAHKNYSMLRRHSRGAGFTDQIVESLVNMRQSFSNPTQLEALMGREQMSHTNVEESGRKQQEELLRLGFVLETWMESQGFYDEQSLLKTAIMRLQDSIIPGDFPKRVLYFSHRRLENLEQAFFDQVSRLASVHSLRDYFPGSGDLSHKTQLSSLVEWEITHTQDQAALQVARAARKALEDSEESFGIVLPDDPSLRRSLMRALSQLKVPLEDVRDPTKNIYNESLKKSFLPFRVLRSNCSREWVRAYIESDWLSLTPTDQKRLRKNLDEQGFREGQVELFRNPTLDVVSASLRNMRSVLQRRCSISEAKAHFMDSICALAMSWSDLEVLDRVWSALELDMNQVYGHGVKKPAALWYEKAYTRVLKAPPLPEKNLFKGALQTFRLGMLPVNAPKHLVFFCLPTAWIKSDIVGDYWLSVRERERLSDILHINGTTQGFLEKRAQLATWMLQAHTVKFFEAQYSYEGQPVESFRNAFQESFSTEATITVRDSSLELIQEPWGESFGPLKLIAPRTLELEPRAFDSLSVSNVKELSKCAFRGLLSVSWKLEKEEAPDIDPPKNIEGTWIHKVLETISISAKEHGGFMESRINDDYLQETIRTVWKRMERKRTYASPLLEESKQSEVLEVIKHWVDSEISNFAAYPDTQIYSIENNDLKSFNVHLSGVKIYGRADRADLLGGKYLLVMDYKTGSSPASAEIRSGLEPQAALYAMMFERESSYPVLGSVYVVLQQQKTQRTMGLVKSEIKTLYPKLKESNGRNLVKQEEWGGIQETIVTHLESALSEFKMGKVIINPRTTSEKLGQTICNECRSSDICGVLRFQGRYDFSSSLGSPVDLEDESL